MGASAVTVILMIAASGVGQTLSKKEVEKRSESFERLWGEKMVWRFDDLPTKGNVPKFRIPYAGYIYPDLQGGTVGPLYRYDMAFHRGRGLASSWERWDSRAHKEEKRGGLFGLRMVERVPDWSGHCNGWAAAAIRHAEPQRSVTKNGVTFSPSAIKGMLAELYIFSDTEMLGGEEKYVVNPATFHAAITNWLGRKAHPLGMENTPGKEVWNYPAFAYAASHAKRNGGRQVEVKMNVGYQYNLDDEYDEAPSNKELMYFHYVLTLDAGGRIIGGYYLRDSERCDMLWVPLKPTQGGTKGNESGCPHLNVNHVLAIWRDSVPSDLRNKWVNVDPGFNEQGPELKPVIDMAQLIFDELGGVEKPVQEQAVPVETPDGDE